MRFSGLFAVMAMVRGSCGVASYDEYRDADVSQSGYLPNHNMDPNIVDSSAFGQIWKVPFNQNEQFYAKPLTYTPLGIGAVKQTSRDPTVNGCNMVCAGNALQWCGGGNRLNLYLLNGTSPAPTSSASVPTGTNSASPSTPTATAAGPVTVSNFTG
ncbi:uncharacterized protein L3040_003278 [Drepanopeziza brunnea f. sp. 'multigermtubi']|uniref:uncharacterized protein n=1 Tax=Drepanopeziza brunnea f. sp. 'multigermtubi' TaxID=698441 RepID=UPI002394269D|nr:hypothetical protein L3040_003278 [Drepanopeziza brunnea f. sp. 'multigermtubi']